MRRAIFLIMLFLSNMLFAYDYPIWINETLYYGSSSTSPAKLLEIKNLSNGTVNLTGYKVIVGSEEIDLSVYSIPQYGFLTFIQGNGNHYQGYISLSTNPPTGAPPGSGWTAVGPDVQINNQDLNVNSTITLYTGTTQIDSVVLSQSLNVEADPPETLQRSVDGTWFSSPTTFGGENMSDVNIGEITGKYYSWSGSSPPTTAAAFSTIKYERNDGYIDFNWGSGTPDNDLITKTAISGDGLVGNDKFAVRWTGSFVVPSTGNYIFRTTSDDGVRLYVNGSLVIDHWVDQSSTSYTATVALTTSAINTFNMEYYENTGSTVAQLYWQPPGVSTFVQFPSDGGMPTITPPGGVYIGSVAIQMGGNPSGSAIYYTNDGSDPTASGTKILYTSGTSITLNESKTIRAAYQKASTWSLVRTEEYAVWDGNPKIIGNYYNWSGSAPPPASSVFTTANNKYSREDPNIDFNWNGGSPDSDNITKTPPTGTVGANNFAVRWTGVFTAPFNDTYTFVTYSDDGVRLYIDDMTTPLIDNWTNHSTTRNAATKVLTAGTSYAFKMEFFENTGTAVAKLYWSRTGNTNEVPFPSDGGYPVFSPAGGVYQAGTNVSITAPSGAVIYYTTDGSNPVTSSTRLVYSSAIPVNSDATIKAAYKKDNVWSLTTTENYIISAVTADLAGIYYSGKNFESFQYWRDDKFIDFNWNGGSPDSDSQVKTPAGGTVGNDNFSVRWTGSFIPAKTGSYTFRTISDDGVRLYIDGNIVINNWTDHGQTTNNYAMTLTANQTYTFKMEFYENTGNAVAKLHWFIPDDATEYVFPNGSAKISAYQGTDDTSTYVAENTWSKSGTPADKRLFIKWNWSSVGSYSYKYSLIRTSPGAITTVTALTTTTQSSILSDVMPSDGKYKFSLDVYNSSNQLINSTPFTYEFWIDDTPPGVSIQNRTTISADGDGYYSASGWANGLPGGTILKSDVTASDGTVENSYSGVSSYTYRVVDDAGGAIAMTPPNGTATAGAFIVSGSGILLTENTNYRQEVTISDNAGNTATVTSAAIKIDKTSPTGTVTDYYPLTADNGYQGFGNTTTGTIWINGGSDKKSVKAVVSAADTYSGLSTYSYRLKDSGGSTVYSASGTLNSQTTISAVTAAVLNEGVLYTQEVDLYDNVINLRAVSSAGIKVDYSPPLFEEMTTGSSIKYDTGDGVERDVVSGSAIVATSQKLIFIIKPSDQYSGLDRLIIYADGTPISSIGTVDMTGKSGKQYITWNNPAAKTYSEIRVELYDKVNNMGIIADNPFTNITIKTENRPIEYEITVEVNGVKKRIKYKWDADRNGYTKTFIDSQ